LQSNDNQNTHPEDCFGITKSTKTRLINFALSQIRELPSQQKAQLVNLALSHILEVCYFRLAEHGFRPNGIVDVGAYHGDWSRFISEICPNVPILMIEAQANKRPQLEDACAQLSNARFARHSLEMTLSRDWGCEFKLR
jgi:hypothetical protein